MSTTAEPSPGESGTIKPPVANHGETRPNGNGQRRRQSILVGIVILAAIAAGSFGYWFLFMRGIGFTADARISGHLGGLRSEVNGRLTEGAVRTGLFVQKGTPVFRLDPSIPQAALDQAQAALVSARASLVLNEALYDKAVNGSRPEEIKGAEATAKRLQSDEEMARLSLERAQALFNKTAVSQDSLDQARTAYASAQQSRESATQNFVLLQEGSRKEDIAAAKAAVDLARSKVAEAAAAVENARSELARYAVQAPFDGWIVRRWLDPGAMPLTAQPVVSMFDPATLRVDANIEEKYLHDVTIGDTADVSIDAYPTVRLQGRVTEILRAANAEFSLIDRKSTCLNS